jgi:hypothetical protein
MISKKAILSLVLILLIVISAFIYATSSQQFLFTKTLTVSKISATEPNDVQPTFYFNITDSGKYLGTLYFRMDPIPPNGTSNNVYVNFQHSGNTRLDSIVFHFKSHEVSRVYMDMSDPVTVTYTPSRGINSYAIKTEFGELGNMQGSNVYQFILYDFGPKSSNLYFSAEISMHYMNFLELTALKANVELNAIIPSL